jgi:hypothetical protein
MGGMQKCLKSKAELPINGGLAFLMGRGERGLEMIQALQ